METQTRTLTNRLRRVLKRHFDGAEVNSLVPAGPHHRVGGVLVWSGFEGMDGPDRQRALWRTLRERLSPEDLLQVSLIMTVTPTERDTMQSNSRL